MENSDSAEEVAWAPRQSGGGDDAINAVDSLGLPQGMRQETSAAINLMAMSFKHDRQQARSAAAPSPPALPLAVPQTDASVPHHDPQVRCSALHGEYPAVCWHSSAACVVTAVHYARCAASRTWSSRRGH